MERINEDRRFYAQIHGINTKHEGNTMMGDTKETQSPESTSGFTPFGSPDSYKDMSTEDKQTLTDKMRGGHKTKVDSKSFRSMGK